MLSKIRDTQVGTLEEKFAIKRFELPCSASMKTSVSPQFTDIFMPVDSVA